MHSIKRGMAVAAAMGTALALVSLGGTAGAATHPATKGTSRPAIHLAHHSAASKNPQGIPIIDTGNWSGYVAIPKKNHAKSFKFVTANYSVPSVNCSVTNYAFSYHWVGLDGWTDGTVEQDGVGSFCVNGTPTYFAWYEMFPAGNIFQFNVNPGDSITSSVTYNGSKSYTLFLEDLTTGQEFDTNQTCASTCNNSSAEVITEGYTSAPYQGTADFGQEHYDTASVESQGGAFGALTNTNWSVDESVALGATSGDPDTQPGVLSSAFHQSAFPLTWLREN